MDRNLVKQILAPYCPPLSKSQVDAIVSEIVKASLEKAKTTKRSRRESKSQS